MPNRELRSLGLGLPGETNHTTTSDTTIVDTTNDSTTMAITATQVNPHHDFICLSSSKRKKLYQKSTEGLQNDQKHDGDAKNIINFVEHVEKKRRRPWLELNS